jgi:drug/metabolite transporter (DMT)-like permease
LATLSLVSKATLCGMGAILLWSALALLTTNASALPPFQLAAMTFTIGGCLGLTITAWRGKLSALIQPMPVWILGIFGLFGYHAFYFAALKLAPPAEANLVNDFWPLLIVLFAAWLLPDETIRRNHLFGAILGSFGIICLIIGRDFNDLTPKIWLGFGLAFLAAIVWGLYSVLSRKMKSVPTDSVTGFCLATAFLSALCHFMFESSVWTIDTATWISIVLSGLGPVGIAFFLWDIGMKQGNIALLSVASYATPVISTFLLIIAGRASPSLYLLSACAFIVSGAFVASRGK